MAKSPKPETVPARTPSQRTGKGGSYVRQTDGSVRPITSPPVAAEPEEGN